MRRLAPTLLVLALAVAACGPAGSPAATGSTVHPAPHSATAGGAGLTSVTPASVPAEPTAETTREARSPDPAFDYGFVVQITPGGFHPHVLVSSCCAAIVWLNLTDRPNSVVFDVEGGASGPIPPGGSWAFVPPNAESIAYHSATFPGMSGALQVNQTGE